MSLDISVHPIPCAHCGLFDRDLEFSVNATHNITPMWRLAGCYEALYETHEKIVDLAYIKLLRASLKHMQGNKRLYLPLNPPNGWGSYDGAIRFLEKWIEICTNNIGNSISVCR